MKYERPVVLATYKVEELMKDAAVCTRYCDDKHTEVQRHFFGR
jgi:hypothetical protein